MLCTFHACMYYIYIYLYTYYVIVFGTTKCIMNMILITTIVLESPLSSEDSKVIKLQVKSKTMYPFVFCWFCFIQYPSSSLAFFSFPKHTFLNVLAELNIVHE